MSLREGSLFSGYDGLGMAVSQVFGSTPAWFSEIEPGPSKILAHHWPDVPNHGDITAIDWDAVEPVDILTGGFPCQDVSAAGKRAGLKPGTRSGLWNHMAYAIAKLRPRYVVAENVRGLLSAEAHSDVEPCPWCLGEGSGEPDLRALGAVLGDLANLGYDASWCGLRAADVGAPHGRYRIFVLATDADNAGWQQHGRPVAVRPQLAATECGGDPAADAECLDLTGRGGIRDLGGTPEGGEGEAWQRQRDRDAAHDRHSTASDTQGPGCPTGRLRGGSSQVNTATQYCAEIDVRSVDWGQYGPAIQRWERVLGRVAPAPTEPGHKGGQRLSPRFVEWMMGLPAGHVTDVPGLSRNEQLKALGNGVVPAQAAAALHHMHALQAVAA